MLGRVRSALFPEIPERDSDRYYRLAMRVRIGIVAFLAVMNATATRYLAAASGQVDPDAYNQFLALNLPGHGLNILLNLWALRRPRTVRTYRAVTRLSAVLELWTVITGIWMAGSIGGMSSMIWFVIMIGVYRFYFDAAIGWWTFIIACALHSGLVALEVLGLVHSGSVLGAAAEEPDALKLLGLHTWNLAAYGIVFVLATVAARRSAELQEVRRRLARAIGGQDRGRLEGALLADCYDLGSLLGRGGMGEVYAARERASGREVAVKVMHAFHSDDSEMLERFRREAEVARNVAGSHVPEVIDVGRTEEGQQFIVMERLHGEDLEAFLRRREKLPLDETVDLVIKIADALDALHASSAIHRDLKPSNIFLVEEDGALRPRLLDFGISRFQEDVARLTRTAAVMGTPGFMAPEVARGDIKNLGPETDVFALGAIAYLMLTGSRPFASRDLGAYIYAVLNEHPRPIADFVDGVPADVEQVLALALAKERRLRYSSAGQLAGDLALAARGELPTEVRKRARELTALMYGDTQASA